MASIIYEENEEFQEGDGYREGDFYSQIDLTNSAIKNINFVVDKQENDSNSILSYLQNKYNETQKDEIYMFMSPNGMSIYDVNDGFYDCFDIKSGANIEYVDERIAELQSSIPTVNEIIEDDDNLNLIAEAVVQKIKLSLIAQNGDEIVSGLTYDETKNAYVLDYDTSLLDGTDYTIELKLG